MFEESFLDFAPSIAERQNSEKILSMMLGRDTNSDDNDSDVYAVSQGSIDTDQASEMGEGEESDAAISSEDIKGEDNANDGELNEDEVQVDNGLIKILVGPKAIANDKKREWVQFDV